MISKEKRNEIFEKNKGNFLDASIELTEENCKKGNNIIK